VVRHVVICDVAQFRPKVDRILPTLNHELRRKNAMKTIVGAALLTLTSLVALPAQGGEPTYTLTDLGAAPDGVWPFGDTLKMGINDHGDVAASRAIAGFPLRHGGQALLYRHGRMLIPNPQLGYEPGPTYGTAVNNKGIAVGFQKDAPSVGPSVPFLFNAKGKITQLPALLGSGRAFAINDSGYVTGLAGGAPPNHVGSQVFLYDGHTIRGIGPVGAPLTPWNIGFGLNEHNEVVGVISHHAFYFNGITVADLGTLGGEESEAMAINTYSEIVGGADTADGKEHAFLYANGQMYDLGPGQANAINDDRWVVGETDTPVAFLWDGVMHDLNGMIATQDPLRGKVHLTDAQAINNRGEIVAEDCSTVSTTFTCEIFVLTPTEQKIAPPSHWPQPFQTSLRAASRG
jgi:probable HAF family extracellular repeat protein